MRHADQIRLVAQRELRERSRSRAFLASIAIMVVATTGAVVLPALLDLQGGTKDIGLAGSTPAGLGVVVQAQAEAMDAKTRVHAFDTVEAGEQAVRTGDIDVLVVDGRRLEWKRSSDQQLEAMVTAAIQLVAVRDRAESAGISPEELTALIAPVPVENVEIGQVAGRSPDDERAAFMMSIVFSSASACMGRWC